MADGFTRPMDTQVARPVAAPNYVQMYSEAVRSALEPMQFLVNYQKELSEEDYRKAQIQNFLADHKDKADQLAEEARGHRATEAMTMMERQIEQSRETEAERHNLIQETHEGTTAAETQRHDKAEEDRLSMVQQETERHNKFLEDQEIKKNELATDLNKANIESEKAKALEFQAQTQKITQENEAKQNDEQVIQEAQKWKGDQNPESLYDTDKHPELLDQQHSFFDRIKTPEGRARLEGVIGEGSSLGREIAERKQLLTFSTQAKNAFQDNFLKTDPSKPTQLRFSEAFAEAQRVEGMYRERAGWVDKEGKEHPGWSDQAIQAYNRVKNAKGTEEDAQTAGRTVEEQFRASLKTKAPPANPKELQEISDTIEAQIRSQRPLKANASPQEREQYETQIHAEASRTALQLDDLRQNNPDEYRKRVQQMMGGASGAQNVEDYTQKFLKPSTVPPGATDKTKTEEVQPDIAPSTTSALPATGTGGGLAALTSAGAPNYLAANDTDALSRQLNKIFGAPLNGASVADSDLPRPGSLEEAQSLPSGSHFLDPEGNRRMVA